MKTLLLAVALVLAAPVAGAAPDQGNKPAAQQGQDAAQQAYEQQVRDAEAARQRYEAAQAQYQRDLARNQAEVRRAQAAQADYQRRMAERQARIDARNARHSGSRTDAPAETVAAAHDAPPAAEAAAPVAAPSEECQDQRRRARGRGRVIGGVIGGVAGGVLGRGSTVQRLTTVALAAPVGALIGDAIASHLDCHEQRQAAAATEQVVERGVGATQTWTSETRPGVTGSSTVTAAAEPDAGNPCVTVTDVIIVDGQETRAPKRMCRRPPTNRYVRV
jgi:surface antigen